ncbi:MAG: hypothetical protein QM523_05860 [Candidatus Pacebacteria bacterium]|nr:hypothetical protein [Candidatus Paceibacterota bacterium]
MRVILIVNLIVAMNSSVDFKKGRIYKKEKEKRFGCKPMSEAQARPVRFDFKLFQVNKPNQNLQKRKKAVWLQANERSES